jgi:hypothetical protein
MEFVIKVLSESCHLLLDAAVYILFGLLVSGLFRCFQPELHRTAPGQRTVLIGVQGRPARGADSA